MKLVVHITVLPEPGLKAGFVPASGTQFGNCIALNSINSPTFGQVPQSFARNIHFLASNSAQVEAMATTNCPTSYVNGNGDLGPSKFVDSVFGECRSNYSQT